MVRVDVYREGGGLTQAEVLRLIAVAWGGEGGAESLQRVESRAQELSRLVLGVLSRPAGEPQPIMAEETAAEARTLAPHETPSRQRYFQAAMRAEGESRAGTGEETTGSEPAVIFESGARERQDGAGVPEDAWAEGSYLHRVLQRFAEQRAAG